MTIAWLLLLLAQDRLEEPKDRAVGMFYTPAKGDEIRRLWAGNPGGREACNVALGISGAEDKIPRWVEGLKASREATGGRLKIVIAPPWPGEVVSETKRTVRVERIFRDVRTTPEKVSDWVAELLRACAKEKVLDTIAGWYLADEPMGKFTDLEWVGTVREGILLGEKTAGTRRFPIFVCFNLGELYGYENEGYNWNGEHRLKMGKETQRNPGWVPCEQIMIDHYGNPADWAGLGRSNIRKWLRADNFHAVLPGGEGKGWSFYPEEATVTRALVAQHIREVERQVKGCGIWFWAWSASKTRDHWDGKTETDLAAAAEGIR